MFDTGAAAKELRFPSASLAFLLKTFCDVDTDKRYQLADWRLRPLSAEMIKYARIDTHYLLFIYDRLREELINKDLISYQNPATSISNVLETSRKICMKIYEKPQVPEDPANSLYYKLLKARDFIARIEDESVEFIMPQTLLLAIAGNKPQTYEDLLLLEPTQYVQMHAEYILQKVRGKALETTTKKHFSNDFFIDAGWVPSKLPYSDLCEVIKTTDFGIEKVLKELNDLVNTAQPLQGLPDGKNTFDINDLLANTSIDENSIPQNIDEIFLLSNNSRKKNKSKQKNLTEDPQNEKCGTTNLTQIFKEIGWLI